MNTKEKPRGQGGADSEHLGSASKRTLDALYGARRPNASLPRPPYGREVEAELAGGRHPNVWLFACACSWERARRRRKHFGPGTALVLPADGEPEAYRWPAMPDLMADVTGLPGDTLSRLAHALVRDGVLLAYLLDAEHPERNLRVKAVHS